MDKVTFINPETLSEETGVFVKYVGPFKAKIKSAGKFYVVDIDDCWAV
jgi:hypothetical protein